MAESRGHFAKAGSLQGIYDAQVRMRLHACLAARAAPGAAALLGAPAKWAPAPVGKALLRAA